MLNDSLRSTDDSKDKNYIQIVLLDYAKAFDHIDPNILITKLQALDIPDCLLRWIESFLMDRQQRVRIGCQSSEWIDIWGTVPQGTLLGVLCFICMINDLTTPCPTIKYVDDTTVYSISNNPQDTTLQHAVDKAIQWSKDNHMNINASKTKEMVISYAKDTPNIPHITIDNDPIERVDSCKLLGVELNDKLTWHQHINTQFKKASTRLFFISQLKRTKMSPDDMVKVYTSLVRPLTEYACQVWHSSLSGEQSDMLESIQERALRMIYPSLSYVEACQTTGLPTLHQRRDVLCKRLFEDCQDPDHKLHSLLPPERNVAYSHRRKSKYPLPKVKTDRYKNSFIPYCLFNFT